MLEQAKDLKKNIYILLANINQNVFFPQTGRVDIRQIHCLIKNPAYGRHQLSRLMRIIGPILILKGYMIYKKKIMNFFDSLRNFFIFFF